jgi:hypothetical protein
VVVQGRATVTLTSALPAHVQLKIGSSFDPVLLGGAATEADKVEGSWQCETGRLWQFDRSLKPGKTATFDFVLIGDVLTPNHPRPSQDLLNAWVFAADMVSAGLYPKTRVEGPHVARCDGRSGSLRFSVVARPPYQFREPSRTAFGVKSGGVHRCLPLNR